MKTHIDKKEFQAVEILVVTLHFFSIIFLITSVLVPIFFYNGEALGLGKVNPVFTSLYSLGGLFVSLLLFSISELLQIFMKIEFNLEAIRSSLAPKKTQVESGKLNKTTKRSSTRAVKSTRKAATTAKKRRTKK